MKRLFNMLTLTTITILVIISISFYFGVFIPLNNQLEKTTIKNFKNSISIVEINVENFFNRSIEATESLSSRTMIKNKLLDYSNNVIEKEDLVIYTQEKYSDGAQVLKNIIKTVRITDDNVIASYVKNDIDINLVSYKNNDLKTKLYLLMKEDIVIINSPIIANNKKIGQDIAAFDMSNILTELDKPNINYSIVDKNNIRGSTFDDNIVVDYRQLLNTNYYLVSMANINNMNKELKDTIFTIFTGILFMIFILILLIIILNHKTYKKIIEDKNKKIDEITILSETDYMLGIYNRAKFMKELEKEISRSNRYGNNLSLVMFDIDNFKELNDNYGHYVADDILKQVSKFVSKKLRKSDIFARYGGDEFIIILPNTNIDNAIEMTSRLKEKIHENTIIESFNISFSFGVTEYIKNENIDDFIKRVDDALYLAKEKGKNRIETL